MFEQRIPKLLQSWGLWIPVAIFGSLAVFMTYGYCTYGGPTSRGREGTDYRPLMLVWFVTVVQLVVAIVVSARRRRG